MSDDPRSLRAVIFDWAGTTVDHGSRAPLQAFLEIFRRNEVDLDESEARGPMGRAKRDHLAAIFALPRVVERWRTRHGHVPTESDVDRLYADFLPLQTETIAQHGDVIPGVPGVIEECRRRGLRIGSTTGYSRLLMDILAPVARAGGFDPEVIVCADDVPQGRPAPWMIFRAAEQLGAFPVCSIVTVDDTPVGIEAGRNAGTWTVAVTATGNSLGLSHQEMERLDRAERAARLASIAADFRRAGAHYTIESVAELIPVLDAIARRPIREAD